MSSLFSNLTNKLVWNSSQKYKQPPWKWQKELKMKNTITIQIKLNQPRVTPMTKMLDKKFNNAILRMGFLGIILFSLSIYSAYNLFY